MKQYLLIVCILLLSSYSNSSAVTDLPTPGRSLLSNNNPVAGTTDNQEPSPARRPKRKLPTVSPSQAPITQVSSSIGKKNKANAKSANDDGDDDKPQKSPKKKVNLDDDSKDDDNDDGDDDDDRAVDDDSTKDDDRPSKHLDNDDKTWRNKDDKNDDDDNNVRSKRAAYQKKNSNQNSTSVKETMLIWITIMAILLLATATYFVRTLLDYCGRPAMHRYAPVNTFDHNIELGNYELGNRRPAP